MNNKEAESWMRSKPSRTFNGALRAEEAQHAPPQSEPGHWERRTGDVHQEELATLSPPNHHRRARPEGVWGNPAAPQQALCHSFKRQHESYRVQSDPKKILDASVLRKLKVLILERTSITRPGHPAPQLRVWHRAHKWHKAELKEHTTHQPRQRCPSSTNTDLRCCQSTAVVGGGGACGGRGTTGNQGDFSF